MVLTRLTVNCTVFDLLTGDSWKIAQLMLDLTEFSMYAENVLKAFEQAEKCYHLILEQEDLISSEREYSAPYAQQKEIKYDKKSLLVKNL
ncbi:hypothetical protein TSAR_004259 [Trichomalopsis sarcophagae]|uniref:Uncharacterized protein n=1 Tax=Trichomalopsis sarcophagae TaxID=543379 RepID=A0A232ER99_9HYME|nr:hypothetical protein TSAR_004259 [Trichomalopsis sarcophagae]